MRRPLFEIVDIMPIEVGDGPVDPETLMDELLHDCPLCREALARGEKPIRGMFPVAPRRKDADPDDPDGSQSRRRKRRGRR